MMSLDNKIMIAQFKYGPEYAAAELADQIVRWVAGTGANGGVVGLSGGIDSTTVAYLCQYAFDKYNGFSPDRNQLRLYGLIMPSSANNPKDAEDGIRVAQALRIEYRIVPVEPFIEPFERYLAEALPKFPSVTKKEENLHRGNTYSEARAKILSRFAAPKNLRVMGTGNRDEDYVLGYFTKRGDGAVDNNILGNLPKRLVRELAAWLGVPEDLVKRVPTAGLEPGQTDQGDLGYDYDTAEIIKNGYDEGKTPEEIQKLTGYHLKDILDVYFRHKGSEHKRRVPPVGEVVLEYR